MKAKVKETGEIIDVKCLHSVTYNLDYYQIMEGVFINKRLDNRTELVEDFRKAMEE